MTATGWRVRSLLTAELTESERKRIRSVLDAAFADHEEGFTDHDWQHALGGRHFVLEMDGEILGHASVVLRDIAIGDRHLRTGYVEAVGVVPAHQGQGLGTRIMREVIAHVHDNFELGALATSSNGFYERVGWVTWTGPAFVRTPSGPRRTPDEDGALMVLTTPKTPPLELSAPISCEWRPGDVW